MAEDSDLQGPFSNLRVAYCSNTVTEMQVQMFLLLGWFPLTSAFYFHMAEREEKCIIEDIPSDTLITGRGWLGSRQDVPRCLSPGVPRANSVGIGGEDYSP